MSESVGHLPYLGSGEDAHGNEMESWGPLVVLEGFGFDPGSSSEPRVAGLDRVIVEPTLYGPYGAPFQPRDHVVVRGETYEVEGEVRQWKHMRSNRRAGSVTSLRRVDG